jgi:hypothetical protein
MDKNMYFRTDTVAMDSTFTSAALKIGPMTHPLAVEIIVPSCVSGDTITAKLSFSDTDTLGIYDFTQGKVITAAGRYLLPFFTSYMYAFLKLTTTDAATATAQSYGLVTAKIVPVGYDAAK